MKRYALFPAVFALLMLAGCARLDNYAEPKSMLSGRVVYQGTPIGVEHNQVWLQLWDPGLGKLASINTRVAQDGSYSELLFNRSYKIVFPAGRGPFRTIIKDATARDTLYVNMSGNQTLDIEVQPYYMIRNAQFQGGEKRVTANFSIEKIISGADERAIERVTLYVNRTQFVSGQNNIAATNAATEDISTTAPMSLTVNVPDIVPAQREVYARVGVKIAGIEQLIFSEVAKVNL